jgi:hypothetical protein
MGKVESSVHLTAALAAAMLLGGCGSQPAPERERPAQRPLRQACDQARSALERASRNGEFLFEETGEAMIETAVWVRMGRSQQDRLIQRLGVLAGCSAATPQREVEVSIRSETGQKIETRFVEPSTDFRSSGD